MERPGSAKSVSGLRGNYEAAGADYTITQDWAAYRPEMHDRWRRLHARQSALARRYASSRFLDGLARLDCAGCIPRFDEANDVLQPATGWRLVAVPGFIPDKVFFDHLAGRRFPVTGWLREEHELDYLVEPDVFHDFFGHVPMLLDPVFADFMAAYGRAGKRAMAMDALDMLARIYWYTVEFGLIDEDRGLRAFGAGLVSSAGEIVYSVEDVDVLRLRFDPARIMRTAYNIDTFQSCYFVLDSLDQLVSELVALDFGPIYVKWRDCPPLPPDRRRPGDRIYETSIAAEHGV